MFDRYSDIEKFITDPEKLQIVNGSEVYISNEENYDIVVDLQRDVTKFDNLKPFIALIAKNICELDNMAQKFDSLHSKSNHFPYKVEIVFIDEPFFILEYWGTEENTQFDVVFEYKEDKFVLKSFGTLQDIPANWEDITPTNTQAKKEIHKKGFLQKLIEWL